MSARTAAALTVITLLAGLLLAQSDGAQATAIALRPRVRPTPSATVPPRPTAPPPASSMSSAKLDVR